MDRWPTTVRGDCAMKDRIRVLILFAVLAELPLAAAQDQQPSAGTGVSALATSQTDGMAPQRPPRNTNASADVRFCLDFATNLEVVMCADKYRPRGRKAAG